MGARPLGRVIQEHIKKPLAEEVLFGKLTKGGPFFAAQLNIADFSTLLPVRVMAVHRDRIHVTGPSFESDIKPFTSDPDDSETVATVGDWLLLDASTHRPMRLLERRSLFKRRAAGTDRTVQLIAANVDTLFIVSSCNQDFNLARLERYLALAREAEVTPVVVLTKADLSDAPEEFARAAAKLLPGLLVETLNALDGEEVAKLLPWCGARADRCAGRLIGCRQVDLGQLARWRYACRHARHPRG
jgi:ribosome biogenesis GTPase